MNSMPGWNFIVTFEKNLFKVFGWKKKFNNYFRFLIGYWRTVENSKILTALRLHNICDKSNENTTRDAIDLLSVDC